MGMLVKVKDMARVSNFLPKKQSVYKSKFREWIPWLLLAIPYLIYWWFVFLSVMYITFIPLVETFKGFAKGIKILIAEPEILVPDILIISSALFIIHRIQSRKE